MNERLAPLMSSARHDWETPQELFDVLHQEFRFTIDAAANAKNHKLPAWLGPGSPLGWENALQVHWDVAGRPAVAWLNPPYGQQIGRWVAKAFEEARSCNATVVALLPVRTDTRWWRLWVMEADEIRLLPGRLRFVGARHPAPFPSCIAIWPEGGSRRREPRVVVWDWKGKAKQESETRRARGIPVVVACGLDGCHAAEVGGDPDRALRTAAMAAGASEDDVRRMVEVARREAKRLGREP